MEHGIKLEVAKLLTAKRGFVLSPRRSRDRKKPRLGVTFSAHGSRLWTIAWNPAGLHYVVFVILMLKNVA